MTAFARRLSALLMTVGLITAACAGAGEEPKALDPNLGGAATRTSATRNAFALPVDGLDPDGRLSFEVGDSFFTKNWVTSPASTKARDGLGPTFNAQACSSCHNLDGRGAPPDDAGDTSTLGLLLRLSVPGAGADGGPVPEPTYGDQLQDRAIRGVEPEGKMAIDWVTESHSFDDGTDYELRRPDVSVADLSQGPLADDVQISPRLAPQVMGAGLLEAIPEESLRAAADPDDADGDGISGRVNIVPDPRTGKPVVGRFGWKANVGTVEGQVAAAFLGDMGITSPLHPDENCNPGDAECLAAPDGGSPEVPEETLGRVVFYNKTLAVPAMRKHEDADVVAGAARFDDLGCAGCHTVGQTTGPSEIAQLSEQTISPHTDLLLHDMGPGLADDRPDFVATGSEWRTPPLWGLGLVPVVNGERFMLHDGRARSFDEAIMWHGGEGQDAADAFAALDENERAELIAYLEAL